MPGKDLSHLSGNDWISPASANAGIRKQRGDIAKWLVRIPNRDDGIPARLAGIPGEGGGIRKQDNVIPKSLARIGDQADAIPKSLVRIHAEDDDNRKQDDHIPKRSVYTPKLLDRSPGWNVVARDRCVTLERFGGRNART